MSDYYAHIQAVLDNFEKVEAQLKSLEQTPLKIKVQLTGLDGSDLSQMTKVVQNAAVQSSNAFNKNFKIDISKSGINEFAKHQADLVNKQKQYAKDMQSVFAKTLKNTTPEEIQKQSNKASQKLINQQESSTQRAFKEQEKQIAKINSLLSSNSIDARLASFNSKLNKYSTDTTEYKNAADAINDLSTAFENLKRSKDTYENDTSDANIKSLINSYQELQKILKATQNEMHILSANQSSTAVNDQLKLVEKINSTLDSKDIDSQLTTFNSKLKQYSTNTTEYKNTADAIQKAEIAFLNLKKAKKAYDSDNSTTKTKSLIDSYQELQTILKTAQNEMRILNANQSDTAVSKHLKQIETVNSLLKSNSINAHLSSFDSKLNQYSTDTAEYQQAALAVQDLRQAFSDLKAAKDTYDSDMSSGNYEALVSSLIRLKETMAQAQSEMKVLSNTQDHLLSASAKASEIKRFESYFSENTKAAKKYADQVEELRLVLNNLNTVSDKIDFDARFSNLQAEIIKNGDTGKSFTDEIKRGVRQIGEFVGVYGMLQQIPDAIISMLRTVVDVDSAITELRKVSNATDTQLSEYFSEATISAQKYGAAISDVISSTADWSRLGYSLEDSKFLSDITTLYQRVGDNMTQESASKSLVSTLQGFQMDAEQAQHIVDAFNEVGNNFAIGSDGIGEALQRSASSLSAAGNTLEQSIGLITAANEVAQDPVSVGTAFKTISMRIRGNNVPIYSENYSLCYAL